MRCTRISRPHCSHGSESSQTGCLLSLFIGLFSGAVLCFEADSVADLLLFPLHNRTFRLEISFRHVCSPTPHPERGSAITGFSPAPFQQGFRVLLELLHSFLLASFFLQPLPLFFGQKRTSLLVAFYNAHYTN